MTLHLQFAMQLCFYGIKACRTTITQHHFNSTQREFASNDTTQESSTDDCYGGNVTTAPAVFAFCSAPSTLVFRAPILAIFFLLVSKREREKVVCMCARVCVSVCCTLRICVSLFVHVCVCALSVFAYLCVVLLCFVLCEDMMCLVICRDLYFYLCDL